ncbi:MAG TPA: TetR/AcrR family transcriptional regulator [Streptosporangiaceae bacterium]|nr:TetR/AcrR family transcriptional regulator [Streptosporangiaceae bacterium]
MSTTTTGQLSARERLLAAAEELFYEEGVHTVGIDRVIERAGVAKATLYSVFGSKDELVRAYLEQHNATWRERLTDRITARYAGPRERLLGVFDVLGERFTEPDFRGCAFVNASAETRPGSLVEHASDVARAWVVDLFAGLARQAGVAEPGPLARQLAMLYHGASLSARMDRDLTAAAAARAAAVTLLDAATGADATASIHNATAS